MLIANRYRPLESFDKGGMGEILYCEDVNLKRTVVLKYLQQGVESRRLLDEQKSLSKVRSKHVVQLYDVVTIQDFTVDKPAIVLELVTGEVLQAGGYSADAIFLNIIWQISCGLADIHSIGIIHRDIKPLNIKIDAEGVVKILDFGLSRSNDNAQTQCIIGTPFFMAPELWSIEAVTFDSSIDVYAFGVTCLALLKPSILPSLQCRPPSQPTWEEFSVQFDGISSEVSKILYRCLATNSEDRPAMKVVRDILAKQLLKNKHRATVVFNGVAHVLDFNNRKITLKSSAYVLTVEYDGLDFKVAGFSGAIYINNTPVQIGVVVPGCSVLTFGTTNRTFVTFDVSNPEVMP